MAEKDNDKLDNLDALENQGKGEKEVSGTNEPKVNPSEQKNILDGYIQLQSHELPQDGELYPEHWKFAYRCPQAEEVAQFSTLNERDQPGIMNAMESLIRKCVIIYDINKDEQVDTGEINDAHRTFFMLLLRHVYMNNEPVKFSAICTSCHDPRTPNLTYQSLMYDELNEKLIEAFDGRRFILSWPGIEEPIEFLIPTLNLTTKIFKYIIKVYRQSDKNDKISRKDKTVYDKQFLLVAPYLYETGRETVQDLIKKYKVLKEKVNAPRFKAYLEIVAKISLDNKDYIEDTCPGCGSLEETQIRFPGGWKRFFVSDTDTSGYFGN